MKKPLLLQVSLLLSLWLFAPAAAFGAPRVLVSLLPLHSLVAAVMQGVGVPELLLTGSASPHSFALRPTQLRSLQQAELLVWVGPELETFLAHSVAELKPAVTVLTLAEQPEFNWLAARSGGLQEAAGHHDENHSEGHVHGNRDLHFWLSPSRAQTLAEIVCRELTRLDPDNTAHYQINLRRLKEELNELKTSLEGRLTAARHKPYVVFHDAYRYFEEEFQVSPAAIVAVNPERPPGARRISEIRAEIISSGISCVFSEPQFEPRLVRVLTEGTAARSGTLDPLGAELVPGPAAYRQLLENLGRNFTACLAQP